MLPLLHLNSAAKPGTRSQAFSASEAQRGSALIYILIAVALLAALTVSLMEPSNQQAQSQGTTNLVTATKSQIDYINSTIQECVLTHPDQDNKLTSAEQKNPPYPIDPTLSYFSGSDPDEADDTSVQWIRCPGNPGGDGPNSKEHAPMFGGNSGKFLPPPPNLLKPWTYYNGIDGVAITISSDNTDTFIPAAFKRLKGMYADCETDIIDRLAAGSVPITTDPTPAICDTGHICFRYWIVRKSTAIPTCP